jgi:hypothetical protein
MAGSGEYQFGHASGTIGRMMGHESMQ